MFSDTSSEDPYPPNGRAGPNRAGPCRRQAEVLLLLLRTALRGEVWDTRSTDPPWGCSLRGERENALATTSARPCRPPERLSRAGSDGQSSRRGRGEWNIQLSTQRCDRCARGENQFSDRLSMKVCHTHHHEEYRGRRVRSDQPSPPWGKRRTMERSGCTATKTQDTRDREGPRTIEQGSRAEERL